MLSVEQAVPGDVASIRRLAGTYADTADQLRDVRNELRSITTSAGTIPFEGLTAQAFGLAARSLPLDTDGLANGYDEVCGALQSYASALDPLESEARREHRLGTAALQRLAGLRPQLAAAQSALRSAQSAASSAASAARSASSDPRPEAAPAAAAASRAAGDAAAHAQRVAQQVQDLTRRIALEEREVQRVTRALEDLREQSRAAARRCAQTLRDAKKEGDSLLKRIGKTAGGVIDAVTGARDVLVDTVTDVAGAAAEGAEGLYDVASDAVGDVRDAVVTAATDVAAAIVAQVKEVNDIIGDFVRENATEIAQWADVLGVAGGVIGLVPGLQGVGLALTGASLVMKTGLAIYADGSWTDVAVSAGTAALGLAFQAGAAAGRTSALAAHNADLAARGAAPAAKLPSLFTATSMTNGEMVGRVVALKFDQAGFVLTAYEAADGHRKIADRNATMCGQIQSGTAPVRRYPLPVPVRCP